MSYCLYYITYILILGGGNFLEGNFSVAFGTCQSCNNHVWVSTVGNFIDTAVSREARYMYMQLLLEFNIEQLYITSPFLMIRNNDD